MKFKKIIAMVLIFAMVMSTMVFAGTNTNAMKPAVDKKALLQNALQTKFKKFEDKGLVSKHADYDGAVKSYNDMSDRLGLFSDSDTVRVVIELEGDSVLRHAISQKTALDSMSDSEINQIKEDLEAVQTETEKAIETNKLDVKVRYEYKTALNGFSAEVSKKDLGKLSAMPNVKKVTVVNVYNRNMDKAVDLTNAKSVWDTSNPNLGFKGEGTLIAIIDTGIDYRHKDLVLGPTGKADMALTQADVTALNNAGTKGKYFTEKVPMGWNWADNNDQVIDLGEGASMHGMHVAGISAANGPVIKGVAPEAQLLAEKVFSNNQETGAFSDDIIAAIDHAITVGADVLNMSLGSTAGFVKNDDPEQKAISDAVAAGVIAVISAGNSAYMSVGADYPMAAHPDTGVVGSPGLATDSFQIAAANNKLTLYQNTITVPDVTGLPELVGYGKDSWKSFEGQDLQLVAVGGTKLGYPEDYAGLDVTGKIVLVKRGTLTFLDKTVYAAQAGAAGIIVYDHGLSKFYKDQGGFSIPFMHVQKAPGEALAAAVANAGGELIIKVAQKNTSIDPTSGLPTSFSSWGPTPDLQFKPEIMAPGGNINSLANNDGYQYMSGTSMSSPHVAGGMALIAEALKAKIADGTLTLQDNSKNFVDRAKIIAMNTAKPSLNQWGYEYQPRLQGAGMMKIDKAILTPVYITDASGKAGISLKEIGNTKTFTLTLTNMSNQPQTYKISPTIATDYVWSDGYNSQISLYMDAENYDADHVATMTTNAANNTVTVNANSTTTVTMTLNVEKAPRNIFVEGYIYFQPVGTTVPQLSVPYYGFYGDWSEPSVIDPVYGDPNSYFGYTGLLSEVGFDPEYYYSDVISPNGDGFWDDVTPIISLLRNAKDFVVNVKDSNGTIVRTVDSEKELRKIHDLDQGYPPYMFSPDWKWDGQVMNNLTKTLQTAVDGQYSIELKTRIDYPNAKWQTLDLPILVDTTAPEFKITTPSGESNTGKAVIQWTTKEEGSGLVDAAMNVYELDASGNPTGNYKFRYFDDLEATSMEIELPFKNNSIVIDGIDNGFNYGDSKEEVVITNTALKHEGAPNVVIDSPQNTSILGGKTFTLQGHIDSPILFDGVLKVNGEAVTVSSDNTFETSVTVAEEGWCHVNVEAYYPDLYDPSKPETEEYRRTFAYKYIIDTTTPDISVNINDTLAGYAVNGQKYLTVTGTLSDASSIGYKFTVNGDTVSNLWFDDNTVVNEPFAYTIPIAAGTATKFEIADFAGNTSSVDVTAADGPDGKLTITNSKNADTFDVAFTDLASDYAGPSIDAITPAADVVTSANNADIVVTATSAAGIKEVYVNDREASLVNGKYVLNIALAEGDNPVNVKVVDSIGMTKEKAFTVKGNPDGPIIYTTMPYLSTSENTMKVTAVITDTYGIDTATINGQPLTLNAETGEYEYVANLETGANDFTIEATDKYGVASSYTFAVMMVSTDLSVAVYTDESSQVRYDVPAILIAETDRPVDWTFTVKDVNGTDVAQYTGRGIAFAKTWTPSSELPSGVYTVEYKAVDGEDKAIATSNINVYNYEVQTTSIKLTDNAGAEKTTFKPGNTIEIATLTKAISQTTTGLILIKVVGPNDTTVAYRYVPNVSITTAGVTTNFGFSLDTTTIKGTYKIEALVWDNYQNAGALCPAVQTTFVVE